MGILLVDLAAHTLFHDIGRHVVAVDLLREDLGIVGLLPMHDREAVTCAEVFAIDLVHQIPFVQDREVETRCAKTRLRE